MGQIYLDNAAATPLDNRVLKAMRPYFDELYHNPSAIYLSAKKVRQDLGQARASIAKILGCKPGEIVFTAGGTEANNLAVFGTMRQFPRSHMVTTALEHDSILNIVKYLKNNGHSATEVKPNPKGIVDATKITRAVTDKTILVSVMYANNEIGTVQPLKEIAKNLQFVREKRLKKGNKLPLYLHTDAAQATNYLNMHVHSLGVDMLSLNGGKIYGPKQTGLLYVSSRVKLEPLIFGGGQEQGLRSGTENVGGAIGLAKALELANKLQPGEVKRLKALQKLFIDLLRQEIPRAEVNGSLKNRLPNNVHITIPGSDNERLLFAFDEAGILAAAGSACSASDDEPSHVLKSLGLSDETARSSLRFTMGRQTTKKNIEKTVQVLKGLV